MTPRKMIRSYDSIDELPARVETGALANVGGVLYRKGSADGDWTEVLTDTAFGTTGGAAAASTKTIASGAFTRTQMVHKVAGQGGLADDLDTVTDAELDGKVTILRPSSDSVDITVKHGTGNIECSNQQDIVLAEDDDFVVLVGNGTKAAVVAFKTKGKTHLDKRDLLVISLTPGAEDTNAIDVVGAITDVNGAASEVARQVLVKTLAVTNDKGDLAAASVAVGTVKKTVNPATGENIQWMITTSGGLFSFKVSNDVAEDTLVMVEAEGCRPALVKLTFT